MDQKIDPLVRPADFRSISLKIALLNLDSKVEIVNGRRLYKSSRTAQTSKTPASESAELAIHITEFVGLAGLVLDAPIDVCGRGDRIRLEIETENTEPPMKLTVEGEVKKVERNDVMNYKDENVEHVQGSLDRVLVELKTFDDLAWNGFKNLFFGRQDQIDEFFRAARGY